MNNTPTATIEDYLGIIYTLERDGEKIIGARLADILHVSAPTVTVTLKRMVRDGWISIDSKKHIHLSAAGKEAARSVIRRHMLTEWLLSRVLDIPWSDLHDEAHKIEHTISKEVEEKLASTMEDPEACPHGNPLPGQEGISQEWKLLTSFSEGSHCTIRRIHELLEENHETLEFLEEKGILPGNLVGVESRDDKNKILNTTIAGAHVAIPYAIAEKLFAD